jgi:hypothetical protein
LKRSAFRAITTLGAAALLASAALAQGVRSGPQIGEKPLPFTSNMVTGEHRGRQFCYVCELKEEPAVVVFARRTDAPTARLLRDLNEAVRANRKEKLFAWMVFLGEGDTAAQTALERQVYAFARENGVTTLPLSALGDPQGPPGYRIAPEAEVTILFFRNGKVAYNRAYRVNDWSNQAAAGALKELPAFLKASAGTQPG